MNSFEQLECNNGLVVYHTDSNERYNWELYLNNDSMIIEAVWTRDETTYRAGWVTVTFILWDSEKNHYATIDKQLDFDSFGEACSWWGAVLENIQDNDYADSIVSDFFVNCSRWGFIGALYRLTHDTIDVLDDESHLMSHEIL